MSDRSRITFEIVAGQDGFGHRIVRTSLYFFPLVVAEYILISRKDVHRESGKNSYTENMCEWSCLSRHCYLTDDRADPLDRP